MLKSPWSPNIALVLSLNSSWFCELSNNILPAAPTKCASLLNVDIPVTDRVPPTWNSLFAYALPTKVDIPET